MNKCRICEYYDSGIRCSGCENDGDEFEKAEWAKKYEARIIDDFVKLCDEAKTLMFEQYSVDMRDIREIAKQLKGDVQ